MYVSLSWIFLEQVYQSYLAYILSDSVQIYKLSTATWVTVLSKIQIVPCPLGPGYSSLIGIIKSQVGTISISVDIGLTDVYFINLRDSSLSKQKGWSVSLATESQQITVWSHEMVTIDDIIMGLQHIKSRPSLCLGLFLLRVCGGWKGFYYRASKGLVYFSLFHGESLLREIGLYPQQG